MDRNTRRAIRIASGTAICSMLLLFGSAGAATITVNASGDANYSSIQAAMNAASNGDTIAVASGTYNENVIVNRSVNLTGAGAGITIINAPDPNSSVLYVTASNVTIDGFTVTNATGRAHSYYSAGIFLAGTKKINISNNYVTNNYNGIYVFSSVNSTMTGNLINSNTYGIYLLFSSRNILANNTVTLNNNYGIYTGSSNNNTIYNNIFNNSFNLGNSNTNISVWNTTRQAGANIIGGSYLGGNFWSDQDGTGFSQTCSDVDTDGICDSNYTLSNGNIDFLPLAVLSGYINGTVMCNGSTIANAAILATDAGNNVIFTTTASDGTYSLKVLTGIYNITASKMPEYDDIITADVAVTFNNTTNLDFILTKKQTGNITGIVKN